MGGSTEQVRNKKNVIDGYSSNVAIGLHKRRETKFRVLNFKCHKQKD